VALPRVTFLTNRRAGMFEGLLYDTLNPMLIAIEAKTQQIVAKL
jgi:hypothetical protein